MDETRTLPPRHDLESVVDTPPLYDSRPLVIVLPSEAHAAELTFAIQGFGLPCLLAFDADMLEHWSRHEQGLQFLVHLDTPWIAEISRTLVHGGAAVIGLSDDTEVRLAALSESFDDALPLSMSPMEIAARLRSRLMGRSPSIDLSEIGGPLRLDVPSRHVWWWDEEVLLPRKLFELLAYLAARPERYVPVRELLRAVWGEPWAHTDKVRKAIRRLREALPNSAAYLISKRGFGYGYFPG
jgi:DNA-binding response OmpR family regulator